MEKKAKQKYKRKYIYLLKFVDGEQVTTKWGYSSKYPKRRLYYWRKLLKVDFKLDFVGLCIHPSRLECEVKWYAWRNALCLALAGHKNHSELCLDFHEELKEFIRNHKYFRGEVSDE